MTKDIVFGIALVLVPIFAAANDAGDYDNCNKSIALTQKPATKWQEEAYGKIPTARHMISDSRASKKATADQSKKLASLDAQLVALNTANDKVKKDLAKYIGGSSQLAKDEKAASGFAAMLKVCNDYNTKLSVIAGAAKSNRDDVNTAYDSASALKAAVFKNK